MIVDKDAREAVSRISYGTTVEDATAILMVTQIRLLDKILQQLKRDEPQQAEIDIPILEPDPNAAALKWARKSGLGVRQRNPSD